MKKLPKYIVLPVGLLLYFVAMLWYSISHNGGKLPEDFALIASVEALILIVLFAVLWIQHKRRGR